MNLKYSPDSSVKKSIYRINLCQWIYTPKSRFSAAFAFFGNRYRSSDRDPTRSHRTGSTVYINTLC
nr:MAG TPA: hypothetical protein [Caudoviricetes sp.]